MKTMWILPVFKLTLNEWNVIWMSFRIAQSESIGNGFYAEKKLYTTHKKGGQWYSVIDEMRGWSSAYFFYIRFCCCCKNSVINCLTRMKKKMYGNILNVFVLINFFFNFLISFSQYNVSVWKDSDWMNQLYFIRHVLNYFLFRTFELEFQLLVNNSIVHDRNKISTFEPNQSTCSVYTRNGVV